MHNLPYDIVIFSFRALSDFNIGVNNYQLDGQLDPAVLNLQGLCHVGLGDIEHGIHCYEKSIEINPMFKEAWVCCYIVIDSNDCLI